MGSQSRREYEEAFGEQVGAIAARAFNLGRHALVILLKALGVDKGDKVGVCGFTCFSVIEAVKVCGATPVYLDVDEYLCINPEQISGRETGSLKVVILQHTFGVPGRLDALLSACEKIGARVIEDCAHSLGCSWNGKPLGTFGEGAIYSFQWGKPYTTGQGGMLTVNSPSILKLIDGEIEKWALPMSRKSDITLECQRRIYSFSSRPGCQRRLKSLHTKLREAGLIKQAFDLHTNFEFFYGYIRLAGKRMATAGLETLNRWQKLQQLRRENTELIKEKFQNKGLSLWPVPEKSQVTMLRYPLLTDRKVEIIKQAQKNGIDIGGWYNSVAHPLQGDELAKVDYVAGRCSRAEDLIEHLVHIPTGAGLTKKYLDTMMEMLVHDKA